MPIIKLQHNEMGGVAANLSDQELIARISHEFPELPQSLTVLLDRFDQRVCGIRQRPDAVSRRYLASGPH